MTSIQEEIFKDKQPDTNKLAAYGFTHTDDKWAYQTVLTPGFALTVTITGDTITTQVTDTDSGLPYTLHLDPANSGTFVGKIRNAYTATLTKIAKDCFTSSMFAAGQMAAIITAIGEQYGEHPEYLWANFPNNAIVRRSDNRKWYALLVKVSADKVGLSGTEPTDVLVLRAEPEAITEQLKTGAALPAYHMNKKHWLSYQLDAGTPQDVLMKRVAVSRELAK